MLFKHLKSSLTSFLACVLLGLPSLEALAQNGVKGTVNDASGMPVVGVTVNVKGTNLYASTDNEGNYQFQNVKSTDVLNFQLIGMQTVETTVGSRSVVNVTMQEDALLLEGTIVTALGIKRDRKALGYAIQEVKGSDILDARETNVVNALSGKVSGLQIVRSSNGPGGSSKIILRGNNSLTGSNQPLIVVDGVPMDNFTGSSNNDYWNPSPDMGNGMSDINPEDIESMSVLKGASAAALYGSRAGNGVILITTKSGKKQTGLGLTVSMTVGTETLFMAPKMQSDFGQGTNGVYDARSALSWGPKIEGQSVLKYDGVANDEKISMRAYDNLNNYFDKPGLNYTENVTFQQAYDNVSVFTSLTRTDDYSIIPGATLNRTNLTTRAVSKFGQDNKWTLDTKVQYIRQGAKNRPLNGNNTSNTFMNMYLLPRSMDITWFKPNDGKNADGNMQWYGGGQQMNPYWMAKNKIATDTRDRFLLTGSLKYEITDWIKAEIKGGMDIYTTDNEGKTYSGSPLTSTGRYNYGKNSFSETNFSALLTFGKDRLFDSKFGAIFQLGGNLMNTVSNSVSGDAGELLVPNLFSINNAKNGKPGVGESFSQKKINSAYGLLSLNWDGWAFVDATFRNDWSSTLSKDNRSFFYPSVSGSLIVSDMLDKVGVEVPAWFSFAKLRASLAQVGNDLSPYQLYNTYSIGSDPTGAPTGGINSVLFNENVKNELITSTEIGTELRFWNNRLGLDVAWYKSNATNQLINLAMDPSSGYGSRKINAGNIENKGWEFMFNASIFEAKDYKDFMWDITANFSLNRNRIISLTDGVDQYSLGGYDDIQIIAKAKSLYGDIYGTTYKRVQEGEYAGQLLLSADGLPQRNTEKSFLGNQQAKGLLGVTNRFGFHNVDFSFLIDARIGGKMFSGTNQLTQLQGTAEKTVVNGERKNIVVAGVIPDGDGFKVNDKEITAQQYWESVAGQGNVGIVESNIYDATNVRIRNVQLGYTFNKRLLKKAPIQSIRLSFTCNNVLMLYSSMNGVDPESVYATGTNAVGFESGSSPTTRSYLFNVTFNF